MATTNPLKEYWRNEQRKVTDRSAVTDSSATDKSKVLGAPEEKIDLTLPENIQKLVEYIQFKILEEAEILPGFKAVLSLNIPSFAFISFDLFVCIGGSMNKILFDFDGILFQTKYKFAKNTDSYILNWLKPNFQSPKANLITDDLPISIGFYIYNKQKKIFELILTKYAHEEPKAQQIYKIGESNIFCSITNWESIKLFFELPMVQNLLQQTGSLNDYLVLKIIENPEYESLEAYTRIKVEDYLDKVFEETIINYNITNFKLHIIIAIKQDLNLFACLETIIHEFFVHYIYAVEQIQQAVTTQNFNLIKTLNERAGDGGYKDHAKLILGETQYFYRAIKEFLSLNENKKYQRYMFKALKIIKSNYVKNDVRVANYILNYNGKSTEEQLKNTFLNNFSNYPAYEILTSE